MEKDGESFLAVMHSVLPSLCPPVSSPPASRTSLVCCVDINELAIGCLTCVITSTFDVSVFAVRCSFGLNPYTSSFWIWGWLKDLVALLDP